MTRTRLLVRVALAAALIGATVPSHGAQYIHVPANGPSISVACNDARGFAHWPTPQINFAHNLAGQGNGKANALRNAMASWTTVPAANHVLHYSGVTSVGFVPLDGTNAIVWSTGNGCGNTASCLALTLVMVHKPTQEIVETDITFNDNTNWFTDGTDRDTESVAAHELGHALGLDHTNVTTLPVPTMIMAAPSGTELRSLEHDDCAGLECSQARYCVGQAGAPPRPASLTVAPQQCFGLNDVDWAASTGATYYELYKSSTAGFTTQTLEYSGPNLSDSVTVPATRYLRVRACNAAGSCSCYRNGNRTATYTNGCF